MGSNPALISAGSESESLRVQGITFASFLFQASMLSPYSKGTWCLPCLNQFLKYLEAQITKGGVNGPMQELLGAARDAACR